MSDVMTHGACVQAINFLVTWAAESVGRPVDNVQVFRTEKGEESMNDVLRVDHVAGAWLVEVRLPDGRRAVASAPESFRKALEKARRMATELEPA